MDTETTMDTTATTAATATTDTTATTTTSTYWPRRLPSTAYAYITRLLLLQWKVPAIADAAKTSSRTVQRILANLSTHGSARAPRTRKLGCPRKITVAASRALEEQIRKTPWMYQDEMTQFIWEEHGIKASQSTVSRLLKRLNLSRKSSRRASSQQIEPLRRTWRTQTANLRADQLVYVDEASFNERSGWRRAVNAPVGSSGRYSSDPGVGRTWSILPAYAIDGYLPCTGIREGQYNAEEFLQWVINELLPHCQSHPAPRSVIVLDDASRQVDPRVRRAVEEKGCLLKFLPPFSPDYSAIELTFSVLKAWIRRHFKDYWPGFDGDFGEFVQWAVQRSRCDLFAVERFRYGSEGYKFQGDLEAFETQLQEGYFNVLEDVEDEAEDDV